MSRTLGQEAGAMILPSTLETSILQLASCFTQPPFRTLGVIVTGWLLAHGRRGVTRILRAGEGLEVKSFPGAPGLPPLLQHRPEPVAPGDPGIVRPPLAAGSRLLQRQAVPRPGGPAEPSPGAPGCRERRRWRCICTTW